MTQLGAMQKALYAADVTVTAGRTFATVKEVRRYVDDLLCEEWFQWTWPSVLAVNVERRSNGATWSYADDVTMTISLAPSGLNERMVLHELAHLCVGTIYGHNARFCRSYLTLVRRQMGFHVYGELLAALRAQEPFSDADLSCVDQLEF
jgi:putative metallohydrolase (TIGR04338 family)